MKAREIPNGTYGRLTVEGRAEWEPSGALYLTLSSGIRRLISRSAVEVATWEVVEPPHVEPDWRPLDLALEPSTDRMYIYRPEHVAEPWMWLASPLNCSPWYARSELGPLVRHIAAPEDDA